MNIVVSCEEKQPHMKPKEVSVQRPPKQLILPSFFYYYYSFFFMSW